MQLFSPKKALLAAALGALSVLGACGDDVVVTPDQPAVLSITPPSANLNVGETANFVVQITGGSATLTTCASSTPSVATATRNGNTCVVVATAPGSSTITATSSTGSSVAAQVNVASVAAISNLTVSPTTANVGVGQSFTIVPNVNRGSAAITPTYAYATSTPSIATVTAAGVVTAVAPGVATITVTANGAGTGFTTTALTTGVTVNVSSAPPGVSTLTVSPTTTILAVGGTTPLAVSSNQPSGAPAAVITYGTNTPSVATVSSTGVITGVGQGNAVITVTATSPAGNGFGASTLTQLVAVTVNAPAQISIANITTGQTNNPVDLTNVQNQIQVALNVTPNGQNINSVQIYICDVAETDAVCSATGRRIAAQQTFTGSTGNLSTVNLFINTAEFDSPDFGTGANANTFYKNGLKRLIATATAAGQTLASNNISSLFFNNQDGFAVQIGRPPNRAQGANDALTYYGGPDAPDSAVVGALSGTGSFTVVPVLYTAARDIKVAYLALSDIADTTTTATYCSGVAVDSLRPFRVTFGTRASNLSVQDSLNIQCTGFQSVGGIPQVTPAVTSSIDNNNDAGPATTELLIQPRQYPRDFRLSSFYRPTAAQGYEGIAIDYAPPTLSFANGVRGGNVNADSGFVNATYAFATGLTITDLGVGPLLTASRNTSFSVFNAGQVSGTTFTGTPVAVGGRLSTVASLGLPESADLTNGAYILRLTETDRLGNRATLSSTAATGVLRFGVDLTAPQIVTIPNTGAGAIPGYVRTDIDSIYSTIAPTYGVVDANAAVFAIRFSDSRSGFVNCQTVGNINCLTNVGTNRGGTFRIVRRRAPAFISITNDAVVDTIVVGTTGVALNAGLFAGDPAIREFIIPIFGAVNRAPLALQPTILASQAAYLTFSGTLADRAGNTTVLPSRSVAIDNATPNITGLSVPAVLTGGTTVGFGPTGTDDLEVISGDLALNYPQLRYNFGDGAVQAGQPGRIRFRRVPFYSAAFNLGFWHNPFQSVTDNKLATPIGPGTLFGSAPLNVPMPFIQQLETVSSTDAPLPPLGTAGSVLATTVKADTVVAWLYDIRSTVNAVGGTGPVWPDSGKSIQRDAPLFTGNITAPTTPKNWAAVGISTFQIFQTGTATPAEFRVATGTAVTNPPFNRVDVVRQRGTAPNAEWEYLGAATFVGTLDQGGTRFFRYQFSFAGTNQAQFAVPALAGGDIVRALGSDVSGNALSTRNSVVGGLPAIPVAATVVAAGTPASLSNGAAFVDVTLSPSVNPNAAALTYSCSSNNALITATFVAPNICRLTSAGTVSSGSIPVIVTYNISGTAVGFSSNTITAQASVNRVP